VLEFRRPTTRSRSQAKSPMAMPSSMQLSMVVADTRARWSRFSGAVIYMLFVPLGWGLFQQLAQAL
jgi:hypothetical protein